MEVRTIDGVRGVQALSAAEMISPRERAEMTELIRAVERVNDSRLLEQDQELTFVFDRRARRPVMKIVNKETGEVIRQIPPEYVLRLAETIRP
jgi:flagellar protein FlaG